MKKKVKHTYSKILEKKVLSRYRTILGVDHMEKMFADFGLNQRATGRAKTAGLLLKMRSKLFANAIT